MDIDIINKTLLNTVDGDSVDGVDISYRFLVRVLTAANVALEERMLWACRGRLRIFDD